LMFQFNLSGACRDGQAVEADRQGLIEPMPPQHGEQLRRRTRHNEPASGPMTAAMEGKEVSQKSTVRAVALGRVKNDRGVRRVERIPQRPFYRPAFPHRCSAFDTDDPPRVGLHVEDRYSSGRHSVTQLLSRSADEMPAHTHIRKYVCNATLKSYP